MQIEQFIDGLHKVKRVGSDKYMACCPSHDDRTPSLSITTSPQGRILVHCWAGCSAADVVQSMGLVLADLFDRPLDYEPPMAFAQKERKKLEGREVKLRRARHVLGLGYSDRQAGKRLSAKDLESEREAYLCLREAGVESDPEVCYYWLQGLARSEIA